MVPCGKIFLNYDVTSQPGAAQRMNDFESAADDYFRHLNLKDLATWPSAVFRHFRKNKPF